MTEKTQWTVFLAGPMPQWKKEMITKKIFSGISYYHYFGNVVTTPFICELSRFIG